MSKLITAAVTAAALTGGASAASLRAQASLQAAQAQFLAELPAAVKATIKSAKVKYDCASTKGNLEETLHNIEAKNQVASREAKEHCDTSLAAYNDHKAASLKKYSELLSEERFTCDKNSPNRDKFFEAGYCEQYQTNLDQQVALRDTRQKEENDKLDAKSRAKTEAEQAAQLAAAALSGATEDRDTAVADLTTAEATQKTEVANANEVQDATIARNLEDFKAAHAIETTALADAEEAHAEAKKTEEGGCAKAKADAEAILAKDAEAFGKISSDLSYLAQHSCADAPAGAAFIECASTKAKKILAGAGASTSLLETFAAHKSRSDFASALSGWEKNQADMKTEMINIHAACMKKATDDHDAAVTKSKNVFDAAETELSQTQSAKDAAAHAVYEGVKLAQDKLVATARGIKDNMEAAYQTAYADNSAKKSASNLAVGEFQEQTRTHGINTVEIRETWEAETDRIQKAYTTKVGTEKAELTAAKKEYEDTQNWNIEYTQKECAADAKLYADELATVQSILSKMTGAMNREAGSSLQFDGAAANHHGTETNDLAEDLPKPDAE
jgi:hypothetical protein